MTLKEAKELIFEITSRFFAPENGVTVLWAEESQTEAEIPFVTLRTRNPVIGRSPNRNTDLSATYQCKIQVEVNLYTNGRKINELVDENTASADMMDFMLYIGSPEIEDVMAENQIDILLDSDIQDMTGIFRDVRYRYRAMATLNVTYWQTVSGASNMFGRELPNTSGGGTKILAENPIETIDEVEIKNGDDENE